MSQNLTEPLDMGSIDGALPSTTKGKSFTAKLSIVDQTVPLLWVHDVYCFKCSDADAAIQALQKGLDMTVRQLPFLAGEVCEDPSDRNCAVVTWSEHRPQIILKQVDPGKLPGVKELQVRKMPIHMIECDLRPTNARDHLRTGEPQVVFAASYAKIDGGLVIGLATQHTFMDGFGIQKIWKKWAYNTSKIGEDVVIGPREPLTRFKRLNQAVRLARERILAEQRENAPKEVISTPETPKPTSNLPAPVLASTAKIFFLSARKLDRLSESIRGHMSQFFSRNTLIAAVLWQTISMVRSKRLSKEVDLSHQNPLSELILAVDSRAILEEVLPGAKDWISNLALKLVPPVTFPLNAFSDHLIDAVQQDSMIWEGGVDDLKGLRCPQSLPRIIKRLTSTYSNYGLPEVAASLGSRLDDLESSDFDYRSLRTPLMTLNGLQLIVTNVSNFDPFNDFGPLLGRPLFIRHGSKSIDGMVIVMPLRKGTGFTEHDKDEVEVMVFLREDDMEELSLDETWTQLWSADPV